MMSSPSPSIVNIKAIRVGQGINGKLLDDVKDIAYAKYKLFAKETGIYTGYKPGAVENMAWLGVGHMAIPGGQPGLGKWLHYINEYGAKLINNGKYFPTFQAMDRTASLTSKCRITTANTEEQKKILRIWNNENLVFYVFYDDLPKGVNVKCMVTTDEDETVLELVGFPGNREAELHYFYGVALEYENQKVLMGRILHTFMRVYSYTLPLGLLKDVKDMVDSMSHLRSKKYRADYLDWKILCADLCLNLPLLKGKSDEFLKKDMEYHLLDVAAALAAMGRFEETAILAKEIGQSFRREESLAFRSAAEAFAMIGNEDEALECFAMHIGDTVRSDPKPNLQDPKYGNSLGGIITSYLAKFEKSMEGRDRMLREENRGRRGPRVREVAFNDEDNEALGAVALLSAVHPVVRQYGQFFGIPPGTDLSAHMKKEYRRPDGVTKVVVGLMRSGDIEEYKKVFQTCLNPNKPFRVKPSFDKANSESLKNYSMNKAKRSSNQLIKYGEISMCTLCGEEEKKLMDCPCKSVKYCSKKCQESHFKFHKKKCSYHQDNKKSKTKQEKV